MEQTDDAPLSLKELLKGQKDGLINDEYIYSILDTDERGLESLLLEGTRLLDAVELDLVNEVAAKSESFLRAASILHRLNDTAQSIKQAETNVTDMISAIEKTQNEAISKLHSITNEKEILLRAQIKLEQILDFVRGQEIIQSMLETHAFADALRVIKEKTLQLRENCKGIRSLQVVLDELDEMKLALEKLLQNETVLH